MQRPRAEGEAEMQIDIHDDADNWLKWGTLVTSWVLGTSARPNNTSELAAQIQAKGIRLNSPLPPKELKISSYEDDKLNITLPSAAMLHQDQNSLAGKQQYPLPIFYPIAFGGNITEANLSQSQLLDFATRRLGEYSIQECQ
jgi:hypothetical protein